MLIHFDQTDLLVGIAILFVALPFVWRRKRSLPYLLFFSVFWMYLLAVVAVVIFPIAINLDPSGAPAAPRINLVPFNPLHCLAHGACLVDVGGNILLTVPFGFGISFLWKVRPRQMPWLAVALGLAFELSQLIISVAFRSGFRTVDINDVMLNAIGVLLGYGLFRVFAWGYLRLAPYLGFQQKWLLADLYEVADQTQGAHRAGHSQ